MKKYRLVVYAVVLIGAGLAGTAVASFQGKDLNRAIVSEFTEVLGIITKNPENELAFETPINKQIIPFAKTALVKASSIKAETPTSSKITKGVCSGSLETEFSCVLNDYRRSKGLGPLTIDSNLTKVAEKHSAWMETVGILRHEGPNGERFFDRCASVGIVCWRENLAKNVLTAQSLLTMWQKSQGHRENLLGNNVALGLGVSGLYVTLLIR